MNVHHNSNATPGRGDAGMHGSAPSDVEFERGDTKLDKSEKSGKKKAGRFQSLPKGPWVLGPTEDINIRYELGTEPLGEPGSFGKVVKARCRATGEEFACKIIPKIKFALKWDGLAQFKREVKIMKMLRHPNIIQFHEFFEDSTYFYIVMELCTGGELIHSDVRGVYSEEDASRLLRQMVSAVAYMHSMKLVHCDLKPDNFLFVSNKPDSCIKLIDFGLSKFIAHRGHFTAATGTPYFIAPEVLVGAYNQSCDLWSLGVVMFIMLFGFPPFDVRREERAADSRAADRKIFQKILRGFDPRVLPGAGPHFPAELPVSESARDLLARLLTTDSGKRLTAEEALNHPWLQGVTASKTHLDPLVLKAMRTFDMQCKFQQAVLHLMVDWLSDVSLQQLQATFSALDTNGDGFISIQDLRTAMKVFYEEQKQRSKDERALDGAFLPALEHHPKDEEKKGDSASTTEELIESEVFLESEVQQIMRRVDINNDGYISYEDLLLSYVSMTLSEKEERMWAAFSKLDVDNSGRVDLQDLTAALNSKGLYDVEEMKTMLSEVDVDEDGMVEFEDFLEIMWQKHRSYLEDQKARIQQKADKKRAKRQQERERRNKAAAAAATGSASGSQHTHAESPRPGSAASGSCTPQVTTPGTDSLGYHTIPPPSVSLDSGSSRDASPVLSQAIGTQPHSPFVLGNSAGVDRSLDGLRLVRNASGTPALPSGQSANARMQNSALPTSASTDDIHRRGVFGGSSTAERLEASSDAPTSEEPDVTIPISFPEADVPPTAAGRPTPAKHEAGEGKLMTVPETRAITPPPVPVGATASSHSKDQPNAPTAAAAAAQSAQVPKPVYVPPVVLAAAAAETMAHKAISVENASLTSAAPSSIASSVPHTSGSEDPTTTSGGEHGSPQSEDYASRRQEGDIHSGSLAVCVPFPPPMTPTEAAQTLGLQAPVVSASITKPLRGKQAQQLYTSSKPPGATAAAVEMKRGASSTQKAEVSNLEATQTQGAAIPEGE